MIQAIGLTDAPRRGRPPAVDDLTFEARPGRITTLLGPPAAGKSTALRLMLQLRSGRGVALFRGRPLHRVPHVAREIGIVLGDVAGHPGRTARNHLRMLTAVTGVPVARADEMLDVVGLSGLADQPLGTFSLGMDRRLGLAAALLGDPHTLVLDEPGHGLSPREAAWLHGLLREYADQGGLVLTTNRDPKEAARLADQVITLEAGRLVADQEAADFARTRLRPRVVVSSPHAERLGALLVQEARSPVPAARPAGGHRAEPLEVVRESGGRIAVYGSDCATVGETAYRHGILMHRLAEEVGDSGDRSGVTPLARADGRPSAAAPRALTAADSHLSVTAVSAPHGEPGALALPSAASAPKAALPAALPSSSTPQSPTTGSAPIDAQPATAHPAGHGTGPAGAPGAPGAPAYASHASATPATATTPAPVPATAAGVRPPAAARRVRAGGGLPPRLVAVPAPGPSWPLRYELRRLTGVRSSWVTGGIALVAGLVVAAVLGFQAGTPMPRVLAGWPLDVPLPPLAAAAGLLGALSFGQEFRYPALAPAQVPVPRRLGLLVAKLTVAAGLAVALCLASTVLNAAMVTALYGADSLVLSGQWPLHFAGTAALAAGCAWAGLLAAAVFRSTATGIVAFLAVPLLITPGIGRLLDGPTGRVVEALPGRLESTLLASWPSGVGESAAALARVLSQPVGGALVLSLVVLFAAYTFTALRTRAG